MNIDNNYVFAHGRIVIVIPAPSEESAWNVLYSIIRDARGFVLLNS